MRGGSYIFFQLQVLRGDLRDHRAHPFNLSLVPGLRIVLAWRALRIAFQRLDPELFLP
jgi:hypothetical protein